MQALPLANVILEALGTLGKRSWFVPVVDNSLGTSDRTRSYS